MSLEKCRPERRGRAEPQHRTVRPGGAGPAASSAPPGLNGAGALGHPGAPWGRSSNVKPGDRRTQRSHRAVPAHEQTRVCANTRAPTQRPVGSQSAGDSRGPRRGTDGREAPHRAAGSPAGNGGDAGTCPRRVRRAAPPRNGAGRGAATLCPGPAGLADRRTQTEGQPRLLRAAEGGGRAGPGTQRLSGPEATLIAAGRRARSPAHTARPRPAPRVTADSVAGESRAKLLSTRARALDGPRTK